VVRATVGRLSNYCINATVRPVTPLACASVVPRRARGSTAPLDGTE